MIFNKKQIVYTVRSFSYYYYYCYYYYYHYYYYYYYCVCKRFVFFGSMLAGVGSASIFSFVDGFWLQLSCFASNCQQAERKQKCAKMDSLKKDR